MRWRLGRIGWVPGLIAVCLCGTMPVWAQRRARRPSPPTAPSSLDLADRLVKAQKTIQTLQEEIKDLDRDLKAERARTTLLAGQLAAAKVKLARAEAELARLTGRPLPPTPPRGVKVEFVTIPRPELDSLGRVRKNETRLAKSVPGATHIVLVSGLPSDHPTAILFLSVPQSRTVTVSYKDSKAGGLALAYLTLKPEGLFWRWNSLAPSGRMDTHRQAEEALRPTMIELRSADSVVAKFHLTPIACKVAVSRSATAVGLSRGYATMRLANGAAPDAWTVMQTKDTAIRFSTGDFGFVLTLNPRARSIAARWEKTAGEQKAERLKAIVSELRRLESENRRLGRRLVELRRKRTRQSYEDYQIRSYEETIAENTETIATLKREQATLLKKSTAMPSRTGCSAQVVLPNGVVLYAIKLTSL